MFERLKLWWQRRYTPLSEMMSVEFDETDVRVRASDSLEKEWNQTFKWADVKRICFKDGGMSSSDIIYVSLLRPERVAYVLTEARGGSEFFGALTERGLFPEEVWKRAIGETSGGMHCWPPTEQGATAGIVPTNEISAGGAVVAVCLVCLAIAFPFVLRGNNVGERVSYLLSAVSLLCVAPFLWGVRARWTIWAAAFLVGAIFVVGALSK